MNKTLAVLEQRFPVFFKGVLKVSWSYELFIQHIWKTSLFLITQMYLEIKHFLLPLVSQIYTDFEAVRASNWDLRHGQNKFQLPMTEEALAKIKKNFTVELEFYDFCKQRLDEQYKKLRLSV